MKTSRIELSNMDWLDDAIVIEEPTPEQKARYERLKKEADERIKKSQIARMQAEINAQNFAAL